MILEYGGMQTLKSLDLWAQICAYRMPYAIIFFGGSYRELTTSILQDLHIKVIPRLLHHDLGSRRYSQHLPKGRTNWGRVKTLNDFVKPGHLYLNQIIPKM